MEFSFSRVTSFADLYSLFQTWNAEGKPVVLDIETTGLDRFKDSLISFQLCQAGSATAYYVEGYFVHALKHLDAPLVLHNFKFDFGFLLQQHNVDLRYVGVRCPEPTRRASISDTMLMHHLVDENREHNLDALVQERWNDDYKERFWSAHKSFQEAAPEVQLDYACRDVVYTGLLYLQFTGALAVSNVPEPLVGHCHQLALALYDTEMRGVRVDLDYLSAIGADLKTKIDTAHITMRDAAPEVDLLENAAWLKDIEKRKTPVGRARVPRPTFNWDSGKQLQALIYGEWNLPPVMRWDKVKKERRPTLDDAALEELSIAYPQYPVLSLLRDYREHQKVFGSFIEGTLERHIGGRIYPSFNVNGTVTGRISSSNPNLQQLPRSGGIRGIYVPEVGHKLISCDYGQLEVVVAAHYSQDKSLLRIIHEGASKHDITAAALGIERQLAKTVNFAMQYLCSPRKVASILGVSQAEGQHAWNKYWEAYAGEKKVVDECKGKVDRGDPIVSLFGRRRRFPRLFASDGAREAAYRQAYSALIQGTGADITHTAFYNVHRRMAGASLGRSLFEVHDEVLIEAKDACTEEAKSLLMETMVEAGKVLSVPLGVDCSDPLDRWQKG